MSKQLGAALGGVMAVVTVMLLGPAACEHGELPETPTFTRPVSSKVETAVRQAMLTYYDEKNAELGKVVLTPNQVLVQSGPSADVFVMECAGDCLVTIGDSVTEEGVAKNALRDDLATWMLVDAGKKVAETGYGEFDVRRLAILAAYARAGQLVQDPDHTNSGFFAESSGTGKKCPPGTAPTPPPDTNTYKDYNKEADDSRVKNDGGCTLEKAKNDSNNMPAVYDSMGFNFKATTPGVLDVTFDIARAKGDLWKCDNAVVNSGFVDLSLSDGPVNCGFPNSTQTTPGWRTQGGKVYRIQCLENCYGAPGQDEAVPMEFTLIIPSIAFTNKITIGRADGQFNRYLAAGFQGSYVECYKLNDPADPNSGVSKNNGHWSFKTVKGVSIIN